MGNYSAEEGRRRNVAFTGTLEVTRLQRPLTHSASQGLQGWQCRGKEKAIYFQYIGESCRAVQQLHGEIHLAAKNKKNKAYFSYLCTKLPS